MQFVALEQRTLTSLPQFLLLTSSAIAIIAALRAFNKYQSKSAAIYFEKLPTEVITTLSLSIR